jgi:acylphosphatase
VVIRRRVVVRGRVQGVGYRASCVAAARRLGVGGWVRNRDDGTVEAVVQGEPTRVNALLAWFRQGPALARVDDLEVREEPPLPDGEGGFCARA